MRFLQRLCLIVLVVLFPGLIPVLQAVEEEKPGGSLPSLSIEEEGDTRHLDLTSLDVSVEMHGSVAEIIYELAFFNHSRNTREGEFALRLPEGATVSTYALEVGGAMRPAVAVEKDKALNAYERIKRRGIDPGIVERKAGNVYRTRIFPIFAEQSKRVRIGYLRRLTPGEPLELSFDHPNEIESLRIMIRGAERPGNERNLPLDVNTTEEGGSRIYSAMEIRPDFNLRLIPSKPVTPNPVTRVVETPEGDRYFAVEIAGKFPPRRPDPADRKEIRLLWDVSLSGRWRDIDEELAALRPLWEDLPGCTVVLQTVRDFLSKKERFALDETGVAALENRIRGFRYHDIADFSKIPAATQETLLVTDGLASSPLHLIREELFPEGLHLLTRTPAGVDVSFHLANALVHDLGKKDWIETFRKSVAPPPVRGLSRSCWEQVDTNGVTLLTGWVPAAHGGKVTIELAGASPFPLPRAEPAGTWNFLRRLRGQQRLAQLEAGGSEDEITSFAMAERLASDHTSLIVLERFRDHVRFEIPPPEPDQLALYTEALQKQSDAAKTTVLRMWQRKQERHRARFPWIDEELRAETGTVAIWLNASFEAFPEEQRNKEELQPYLEWLDGAREVLDRRNELESTKHFEEWLHALDESLFRLTGIRAKPPVEPADGRPHVSVRGFVANRGVYTAGEPFTLRAAIDEAGGPNPYGSLTRVYLYRDAQRTGFNLESPRSQAVLLDWGDMLVVESALPPMFLSGDPFSSPAADPFVAAGPDAFGGGRAPAVFEKSGDVKANPPGRPGDSGDPFGSSPDERSPMEAKAYFNFPEIPRGVDDELLQRFSGTESPADVYRAMIEEQPGDDTLSLATLIEIARLLFAAGETEAGAECLRNLLELHSNPISGVRALAYWLAEFGQADAAADLLRSMTERDYDDATLALLWHDLGRITRRDAPFGSAVQHAMRVRFETSLATISITDQNGQPGNAKPFDENDPLPSDMRIVITSIGDQLTPRLREPGRTAAVSDTGVIRTSGKRVSEFLVRQAWPGTYGVSGMRWTQNSDPITIHVEFYTNWARNNQKRIARTMLVEQRDFDLGTFEFSW